MPRSTPIVLFLTLLTAVTVLVGAPARAEEPSVERGRYLVEIAGCNDCHTAGWLESAGQTPEDQWLLGSPLGFKGPWGTTYGANLRISLGAFDEDDWLEIIQAVEYRPPMPWWSLRAMTESDLRSIHRFVTQLGEVGEMAPSYVAPGEEPPPPFVTFPSPPPQ